MIKMGARGQDFSHVAAESQTSEGLFQPGRQLVAFVIAGDFANLALDLSQCSAACLLLVITQLHEAHRSHLSIPDH